MPDVSQSSVPQANPPQMPSGGKPTAQPPKKPAISQPILLFGGIGLLIAVAVIGYSMLLKPQEIPPVAQPAPTATPQELTLTLESPADGTLAVENEILVKGTTAPDTTVAIFTETDETIVETDAEGQFETTVQLTPGINSLNITAYSSEGEEKTITLTIVYDDQG